MHNYTILTKAERNFFKQAIKHEKKKYIIISIVWNLFFAIADTIMFLNFTPNLLAHYVFGAILAIFTLLGIVLIFEVIKKCNYWKIEAFLYRRAKILSKREETIGSTAGDRHHYYFADVVMDNGQHIKDMPIQRNIYIMKQEDVVIAKSEDEQYKYIFNIEAQTYAEIVPIAKQLKEFKNI